MPYRRVGYVEQLRYILHAKLREHRSTSESKSAEESIYDCNRAEDRKVRKR